MPIAHCTTCRRELKPGFVSVRYQGTGRRLTIKLNQIPAEICTRCQTPHLTPEVQTHLRELGLVVADSIGPICEARSADGDLAA